MAGSTRWTPIGRSVGDPARSACTTRSRRGAVHYVALGDKHSRTRVGDTGRMWYSGSPEVTNYEDVEPDPGHVLVVDIDEDDPARTVTVTAQRVGRWRFVTLRRSVDSGRDMTDLDINLDLMADKERTVVRLALTGSLSVTDRAALDACLDRYSRVFASLRIWERRSEIAVVPPTASSPTSASVGSRRPRSKNWSPPPGRRTATRRRRTGGAGAVAAAYRRPRRARETAPAVLDELPRHHAP